MLPDFVSLKRAIADGLNRALYENVRSNPLLAAVKREVHHEGNRSRIVREDGDSEESSYVTNTSQLQVETEDIISKGPLAFVEEITKSAEEMRALMSKRFFEVLDEAAKETGNRVACGGQPLSFEKFLEAFGKMDIEFDENGNFLPPSLVVNPVHGAVLSEQLPKWLDSPKFQALLERKKGEWNDREGHRKLVD